MSGDACDLVNTSLPLVPEPLASAYEEVLYALLHFQLVESSEFPDECWRVVRGTGMGLPHSGDVVDACFAVLVEHPWATRLEVQQEHQIQAYWRFKDDILILGTNKQLAERFVKRICTLAGFFKVTGDPWQLDEVQFLEVAVRKNLAGSVFTTCPKYRDSDISKPLGRSSAHPEHVHTSWPKVLSRRIANLTNCKRGRVKAMAELERRFVDNFADPSTIHPVGKTHGCISNSVEHRRPSWITFGYHPGSPLYYRDACVTVAVIPIVPHGILGCVTVAVIPIVPLSTIGMCDSCSDSYSSP